MPDRPSGSWIEDPETGELTPNLDDPVMKARYDKTEGPHIDNANHDIRNTNDDPPPLQATEDRYTAVKKGGKQ